MSAKNSPHHDDRSADDSHEARAAGVPDKRALSRPGGTARR